MRHTRGVRVATPRVRILIASADTTSSAADLVACLRRNRLFEIVGVAGSYADALLQAQELAPDVIVSDLVCDERRRAEPIVAILARSPTADAFGCDLRAVGYVRREAAPFMVDVAVALQSARVTSSLSP